MYKENDNIVNRETDRTIISKIISQRSFISKNELDSYNLLKRVDSKYVVHNSKLFDILEGIPKDFSILEINGNNIFTYENTYFDSDDYFFYKQHHNNIQNRSKVRIRNYIDTHSTFLEIKSKNNKKETSKIRLEIEPNQNRITSSEMIFLKQHLSVNPLILKNVLNLSYSRITFVNKFSKEKITIDFNIKISNSKQVNLTKLIIIEHKCLKTISANPINLILKSLGAKKLKISKYCLGLFLANKQIKINRFKQRYLFLLKIINPRSYYGYNINIGSKCQLGVFRFYD
jgi:hypothetical protein